MNFINRQTLHFFSLKRSALLLTILLTCLLLVSVSQTWAQSSLGIGTSEVSLQPTGPFAHLILWINAEQKRFYLLMTTALKAMREDLSSTSGLSREATSMA